MALAPRLVTQLLSPQKPATVILMPTDRCNCSCATCSNPRVGHSHEQGGDELSLDEYVELARASGPFLQVALGGGEPFLRSDLTGIVQALYEHARVRLFSIPTNGSQVESTVARVEAMTCRCRRATFNLMVSIDALGERHDTLRGQIGLFESAIKLCHELLHLRHGRRNLNVVINTTICEHNLEDIPDLCAFLAREFDGQPVFHNTSFDQRIDTRLFSARRSLEKALELEQ